MSITLPCFHDGKFIGVAGTDINIDDLLSDITFFNQGQSTYAFMISNSGRTLIHPLLPAPTDAYGDPVFLDIRTLEAEVAFEEVFDAITKYVILKRLLLGPVKRRTSHESNLMQMTKNNSIWSFALGLTHVKLRLARALQTHFLTPFIVLLKTVLEVEGDAAS